MKRKFSLYVTDSDFGMGMVAAKNINEAKAKAIKEIGTYAFRSVHKAAESEIAWYKGMGGIIPETYYELPRRIK